MVEILNGEFDGFVSARAACGVLGIEPTSMTHLKQYWYMDKVRFFHVHRQYFLVREDVEHAKALRALGLRLARRQGLTDR